MGRRIIYESAGPVPASWMFPPISDQSTPHSTRTAPIIPTRVGSTRAVRITTAGSGHIPNPNGDESRPLSLSPPSTVLLHSKMRQGGFKILARCLSLSPSLAFISQLSLSLPCLEIGTGIAKFRYREKKAAVPEVRARVHARSTVGEG